MSRSRYNSEEAFQTEIDRLQRERNRLLKERNPREEDSHRHNLGVSHREHRTYAMTAQSEVYYEKQETGRYSRSHPPEMGMNVENVKMVLEEIMRNSSKSGMDYKMGMEYLKEIQEKLSREIKVVNAENRRTPQTDTLLDLRNFVEGLIEANQQGHIADTITKARSKDKFRRGLENIPEAHDPELNGSSESDPLSSENTDSNPSLQAEFESRFEGPDMRETTKRAIGGQNSSSILDILENKIFQEVSQLRVENAKLKKDLEEQIRRNRSPSRNTRKDSGENETIINQLSAGDAKHLEMENYRLKNRIRGLELELLSLNKDSAIKKAPIEERQQALFQQKNSEINHLRRELQKLVAHLERNKQQVEGMKNEIIQLNEKVNSQATNEHRLLATIRTLTSEAERSRVPREEIRGGVSSKNPLNKYASSHYRPTEIQHQEETLNRKASDFRHRGTNAQTIQRYQNPFHGGSNQNKSRLNLNLNLNVDQRDKLGEYRDVLASLKAIKK